MKIENLLLKEGLISREQIEEARKIQGENESLPETIEKLGYVSSDKISYIFSKKFRIPYIPIDLYSIGSSILNLLKMDYCLQKKVLPLDRLGNFLTVAMVDPLDFDVRREIEKLTSLTVRPVVCSAEGWRKVIALVGGTKPKKDEEKPPASEENK